ncbi:MAG: tRNA 2-selenouridine(34) synthase MnmH [Bacteroidetes bacterium]|nr:tRNA 2-selenouridine(34) synthase MnmH [Bacteroidota bacterium]
MAERVDISRFLAEYQTTPVIDVRSPGEYSHGHIPGAINLPLFTDEERAIVGKTYHMQGKEDAVREGLKLVGPKMQDFMDTALNNTPGRKVVVYCWRGGLRSASIAFLLETAGMKVMVLEGGYKTYRRHVLDQFGKEYPFIVLGGYTGTGKTEILEAIRESGEQVIDLESLAGHKGSAFGHLGLPAQPFTEHFENLLVEELSRLVPGIRCWIEDESITIGRVNLPKPFFDNKQRSLMVRLVMPRGLRAARLVKEYLTDIEGLSRSVDVIKKKLGGEKTHIVLKALSDKDYLLAATELLEYYDKTYAYSISQHPNDQMITVETNSTDPKENARLVLKQISSSL